LACLAAILRPKIGIRKKVGVFQILLTMPIDHGPTRLVLPRQRPGCTNLVPSDNWAALRGGPFFMPRPVRDRTLLGALYDVPVVTGKKPSHVFALVDLANRRLQLIAGS